MSARLLFSGPILALALLSAGAASAQGARAMSIDSEDPKPLSLPAPKPSAAAAAMAVVPETETTGTTIIGDQESPIGLYITPWKNDYAERGFDRPARLLDEAMEPIDPATFRRQVEYHDTITTYRRQKRGESK